MPRPKYGLGQGLEALVSSRQRPNGWPDSELLAQHPEASVAAAADVTPWEYAALTLLRRQKKRRRKLILQLSHPQMSVKPRRQRMRGVGPWTALGMLGADGWELVGVHKRAFLLKRASQGSPVGRGPAEQKRS